MKFTKCLTAMATTVLLACQPASDNRAEADLLAIRSQLGDIEDVFTNPQTPIQTLMQNYLEFFVDDPLLLPPGEGAVLGYDAALLYYTEGFTGVTVVDLAFQTPDILLDGDMAVRRYVGSSEGVFEGETFSSTNRYIDVLRRQPDGEWLTVWHAWTSLDQ